jgi:zinc protease
MTLDRTIAPDFQAIQSISIPDVQTFTLANGQPLHLISVPQQPVMRLECIFEAGNWREHALPSVLPGAAQFAIKLLAEGTASRSSAQISDYFDRYGAFVDLNSGPDRASLVVYCLTKYLPDVLPLVREMLTEPTFPEKEFADLKNITQQGLKVNLEKNSYVAGTRFREKLFGLTHPYGRTQQPDTLDALDRNAVQSFYEQAISRQPFRVLLAGQAGQAEVDLVNTWLGQLPIAPVADALATPPTPIVHDLSATLVSKPESLQSTIRLGKPLFTRAHPDFFKMLVTNEVFGGYFGSRLMKNIREDKGFTYGISSNLVSFRHAGYFMIGTDVKKEFTQQTLDEIGNERHRLQTEPVSADELTTVQNFMAGEFVGSLNTPFEVADRYKVILLDGLPADFLTNYIANLRAVTPADIQQMARQHLTDTDWVEVVVGGL